MGKTRKHVTGAVTQDVQPPDDNQHIVRALGSRGGNIVEVSRGLVGKQLGWGAGCEGV
jgi:hypothetical protein